MIIRNFGLYLNAGVSIAPVIHTNQYDRGEQWVFTLYQEDGSLYIPETGAIVGIKADGNVILNSAAINAAGQVVVSETEQMTAVAGDATFELSIDDGSHGTANFVVRVERKPTEGGTMSQSDISYLQDIADQVEADKVVVVEAEETVLDAESRISSIVPGNTGADGDLLTKSGSGAAWSGAIPAKVGNLEGSVATIEASTALASHAIGEYVIVNGVLYEVTAAISAGESIVPGTNVVATSVGAEINQLNSNLNMKVGDGIVVYVTWDQAGWTALNNVVNTFTVPAISGFTCIGMIVGETSTYRIQSPYAHYTSGTWQADFYAANVGATTGSITFFPVYKKN